MNRKALGSMTAVAVFVASAAVMAEVILNPDGTGFVGKGDVQSAFGWNNAQLQANADGVSFAVLTSQARQQECVTTGAPPQVFVAYRHGVRELLDSLKYKARVHQQIDGFILEGFAGEGSWSDWGPWMNEAGQALPGNDCPGDPGESHPKGSPEVLDPVIEGLVVTFGGTSVQLQ